MDEEIDTEAAQIAVAELFASYLRPNTKRSASPVVEGVTRKRKRGCVDLAAKYSKSARCIGEGCPNRAVDVSIWKDAICEHGIRRGNCECRVEQPFRLLHLNRSSAAMTMLFAELVLPAESFKRMKETNRLPSQHWRICSDHFHESQLGRRNAFPFLGLGKTHAEIREIVRRHGLESELPPNFESLSLKTQRLRPCFSINRTVKQPVADLEASTSFNYEVHDADGREGERSNVKEAGNDELDISGRASTLREFINSAESVEVSSDTGGSPSEKEDGKSASKESANDLSPVDEGYRRALIVSILRRRPMFKCLVRCCPVTNHVVRADTGLPFTFSDLPAVQLVRMRWLEIFKHFDPLFEFPPPLIGCGKYGVCERHFGGIRGGSLRKKLALSLVPNANLTPEEAAKAEIDKTSPLDISLAKSGRCSININREALRREMVAYSTNWCCREVPEVRKMILRLSSKVERLYELICKLCIASGVEPIPMPDFDGEEDDRLYGKCDAGSLVANESDRIAMQIALEGLEEASRLGGVVSRSQEDGLNDEFSTDIGTSEEEANEMKETVFEEMPVEINAEDEGHQALQSGLEHEPQEGIENSLEARTSDVKEGSLAIENENLQDEDSKKEKELLAAEALSHTSVKVEREFAEAKNSEFGEVDLKEETSVGAVAEGIGTVEHEVDEVAPSLSPHVEDGPPLLFAQVDEIP